MGGGGDFPHLSRPSLGPTQPPIQWVLVSLQGVKRPGLGADHPPPSSAEIKGRIELYLYTPSGLLWPVLGRTLPFLPLVVQVVTTCYTGEAISTPPASSPPCALTAMLVAPNQRPHAGRLQFQTRI